MSARRVRIARATHKVLAVILVACIVVQVLLAGLAVLSDPAYWSYHRTFVHVFELVPAFMLLAAWLGRGTPGLLVVDGALFFIIGFQYAFVSLRPSHVASLHAANALLIFWVATRLAAAEPAAADAPRWRPGWRA